MKLGTLLLRNAAISLTQLESALRTQVLYGGRLGTNLVELGFVDVDALTAPPRRPVTRRDYVEFLRPFARDYEMTPQADQWSWRHGPLRLMPPLAVFALDGDRELGQRVKADLRMFARWVDQCVATKGVVFCLDAATFCTMCAQELRQRGLLSGDDETWVRELLLKIRQYHPGWAENGPWDGWFRGSHRYVEWKVAEKPPVFVIILDLVGKKDLTLHWEGHSRRMAPNIVDLVWEEARSLGVRSFRSDVKHTVFDYHVPNGSTMTSN